MHNFSFNFWKNQISKESIAENKGNTISRKFKIFHLNWYCLPNFNFLSVQLSQHKTYLPQIHKKVKAWKMRELFFGYLWRRENLFLFPCESEALLNLWRVYPLKSWQTTFCT
jgi:hypothetical protein